MAERHTSGVIDSEPLQSILLGEHAEGSIEASDTQQEHLPELIEKINNGEYQVRIEWDESKGPLIIIQCIDGRTFMIIGPSSAGGTMSLAIAEDLTTKRYAHEDGTTAGAMKNLVESMVEEGLPIGGHNGDHATGDACGCGACDKQPDIYRIIAEKSEVLQQLATDMDVMIPSETSEKIANNARQRIEDGGLSSGAELSKVLAENASDDSFETLKGAHKEVLIVVNKKPGTTIDRGAIARNYDGECQVFVVDAWAFEDAARAISPLDAGEAEIQEKVAALVYYNLATALALCGPNMQIITIE